MLAETTVTLSTDRLGHSWKGDWNHFNNGQTGAVYYTEDSHYVWIPNGTERLEATFSATEFELDSGQAGSLQLEIDLGEDGSNDAQGQGSRVADTWYYDLDVDSSAWGQWAHFDVTGQAVTLFGFTDDPEFFESRIPYTVDVVLTLALNDAVNVQFDQRPDFYSDLNPIAPSEVYDESMEGMLTYTRGAYDQHAVVQLIQPKSTAGGDDDSGFFGSMVDAIQDNALIIVFLLLIALGVATTVIVNNGRDEEKAFTAEQIEDEEKVILAEQIE